ncbi:MAG: nucleotidyltransferase domain-containing protein [bacterium]
MPIDFQIIKDTLKNDERVIFAYLYGSSLSNNIKIPRDIDLAVYVVDKKDAFIVSSDLKVKLSKTTNIPPDSFDVRIINDLLSSIDAFSLFYLKDVLEGEVLVDKDFHLRANYIERYSLKYRSSIGILDEVICCGNR